MINISLFINFTPMKDIEANTLMCHEWCLSQFNNISLDYQFGHISIIVLVVIMLFIYRFTDRNEIEPKWRQTLFFTVLILLILYLFLFSTGIQVPLNVTG